MENFLKGMGVLEYLIKETQPNGALPEHKIHLLHRKLLNPHIADSLNLPSKNRLALSFLCFHFFLQILQNKSQILINPDSISQSLDICIIGRSKEELCVLEFYLLDCFCSVCLCQGLVYETDYALQG